MLTTNNATFETIVQEAIDAETKRLTELLNTPEILNFSKAVELEAAHQRERWPAGHDEQKTRADWLWLIAYLTTKAANTVEPDWPKRLHRIVTIAAAACNWHAQELKQAPRVNGEPPR